MQYQITFHYSSFTNTLFIILSSDQLIGYIYEMNEFKMEISIVRQKDSDLFFH